MSQTRPNQYSNSVDGTLQTRKTPRLTHVTLTKRGRIPVYTQIASVPKTTQRRRRLQVMGCDFPRAQPRGYSRENGVGPQKTTGKPVQPLSSPPPPPKRGLSLPVPSRQDGQVALVVLENSTWGRKRKPTTPTTNSPSQGCDIGGTTGERCQPCNLPPFKAPREQPRDNHMYRSRRCPIPTHVAAQKSVLNCIYIRTPACQQQQ